MAQVEERSTDEAFSSPKKKKNTVSDEAFSARCMCFAYEQY
jgi:hypothetical protein